MVIPVWKSKKRQQQRNEHLRRNRNAARTTTFVAETFAWKEGCEVNTTRWTDDTRANTLMANHSFKPFKVPQNCHYIIQLIGKAYSLLVNLSYPQFPALPLNLELWVVWRLRIFTPTEFSQGTIRLPVVVCTDNLSLITYHSAIKRERKLNTHHLHLPLNDFVLNYLNDCHVDSY